MYIPFDQMPQRFMSLVLRTEGDPTQLARSVQAEIWEIDPDLAVSGVATMHDVIANTVAVPRLLMSVLAAFAAAAMLLAAIGIYGVMSYNVGQRTQEIGVRIALGANARDVLRMVVGRGMALMLGGVALGLGASLLLSRFLESLLFEISARDPFTFTMVPAALALVALVACYVPAMRASRVDPIVVLRSD
jgi:putative ABC transport system permease protein